MRLIGLSLGIVGAFLSVVLLYAHVQGSASGGNGAEGSLMPFGLCGSGANCDRVLNSRWAWLPPVAVTDGATTAVDAAADESGQSKDAADEAAAGDSGRAGNKGVFRVPVALVGLFYFTALICWFAGFWQRSQKLDRVALAIVAASCLGSVAFICLMLVVIRAVCPYCMGIHLTNFALLGLMGYGLRARRGDATAPETDRPALSLRRASPVVGLLVALWVMEAIAYRSAVLENENAALKIALDKIQSDTDAMDLVYFKQPKFDVPVRDDARTGLDALEFDAMIPAIDGYRNTVVVFGDVECGSCRRFHEFLMADILPRYDGHLRVVYKHLPYEPLHPNSHKAALALEAARRQGAFWELLEILYGDQSQLARFDYGAACETLGMDRAKFSNDMVSPGVAGRIAEDVALAAELGVTGTPTVFLNGRRVDRTLLRLPGFWNGQIERLKRTRARAGQGWGTSGAESVAAAGD